MRALDKKLLRDLWHLRGQVLAIALIVASGTAVLVMSLTAIEALSQSAAAYYERYRFADVFAGAKRVPQSVAVRLGDIPGVQLAEPRIVKYATLDMPGFKEPVIGALISVPDHGPPHLNGLALRAGRYLLAGRPDEIIVSEPFAEAHSLEPGAVFHALLNGRHRALEVVGIALSPEYVYAIGPGALMPDKRRYGIGWMSESALAAAFDLEGAFNNVTMTLERGAPAALVLEAVDSLLEPYGGVGAIERKDQMSNWFVNNEIEQLRALAEILPAIFLAVAAFLSNLLLARLVAIERAEIGLLKAFGYSNAAVMWHYAKLVLVMTSFGIVVGWVVGLWLGRWNTTLYADMFRFPTLYFQPGPAVFAISGGVSLAASLLGAVAAARRAGLLPPAEAMRPPVPPVFRRRGLARGGPAAALDEPTRIILRQLLRRPLRSLLSSAGIATSVAILVTSLQWLDSIERIVDDFFYNQQRSDVTLGLVAAAPASVANDAARLPGVLATEAQRTVPARFRFGAKSRREVLIGLPSPSGLEVLSDSTGAEVDVPADGLLLSSALAERLGAWEGDAVVVEVLEGRRPTLEIEVARVFDTLIGTSAYMNVDTLTRSLGEPRTANVVAMVTDIGFEDALFAELKKLPTVAGSVLKRAAVAMFDETIAEMMYIFISFYVVFACTLAFGVVYNNMRLSLSERGRELATLRVLGFTRGEVSYMLLGEAALLVLIALPTGCALGFGLAHLIAANFETELFRVPVVIYPATYGWAMMVTLIAALASGLAVQRRIRRLDLIAVLKTRE
jgi:putative ABC transport system permease protein